MNFELTTLGTASALPMGNRYPSAHVLNVHGRLFLIDCGEGCQMQLRRHNFSFNKIDHIFISHTHGDHLFGLFGLLSTLSMLGRSKELHIYAPVAFEEILSFYISHFGEGLTFNVIHNPLSMREPEVVFEGKGLIVSVFPLNHRVDTYGFRFDEREPLYNVHKEMIEASHLTLYEIARLKEGKDVVRDDGELLKAEKFTYKPYIARSFAYCSDTAPFKKLTEWIKGVDLLYHEATFAEDMSKMAKTTFHSTAKQAAQMAHSAQVGKLVMGHFSSRYPDLNVLYEEALEYFPECELAKEGMKFEVPIKKDI